jgi:hypothetical protein
MFHSLRAAVVLALGIGLSGGCGTGDGLTRGPVKGRVTVGGQPLAKGRILFLPVAPSTGPTVSAAIVNGNYELPSREGPIVGPNRVEVEAELDLGFAIDDEAAFAKRGGRPLPPSPIPPSFNRNSTLVIEIKPHGENVLDVSVPAAAQAAAVATR